MQAPSRRVEARLVAVAAIACILATFVPSAGPIRAAGAVLLTLVLPGFAVMRALPRSAPAGRLELVTLSIAVSIAFAAVGAVLIDLSPWPISGDTWAVLLGGITLAASLAAMRVAGPQAAADDAEAPAPAEAPLNQRARLNVRTALVPGASFAVALAIAGGAMLLTTQSARQLDQPNFTQLWLLPTADPKVVVLGVHNAEPTTLVAGVQLSIGTTQVQEWSITLARDATWEQRVTVPGLIGNVVPLTARLYPAGNPSAPDRTATLWPR